MCDGKRKASETVDAIGFRHLLNAHQAVANAHHIGSGGEGNGERTAENTIIGIEVDRFEHEIRKFAHRLRDAEEHAACIEPFYVNRRVVQSRGIVRRIPARGDEVVAEARFVLQGHGTGAAMQFKTLILRDIGHYFIAIDGTAVRTALTVVEHFVGEFENGFPIQAAHEIGGEGRGFVVLLAGRLLLEEGNETAPSPPFRGTFSL